MALAALLVVTLVTIQPARAASDSDKQARLIEKVKIGVSKLGVGKDARVTLKLRDKTQLAGYISEIGSDSFTVTNAKTGASTAVPYGDVTQVKGHNLSTGAKIAIGVAIGVGMTLILLAVYIHCCTG
jgi:hypothetical protein